MCRDAWNLLAWTRRLLARAVLLAPWGGTWLTAWSIAERVATDTGTVNRLLRARLGMNP